MAEATAVGRRESRRAAVALRGVPVWVWLVALVVVSTLIRWWIGRRSPAPWVLVDELIYSELAKSFAAGGHLLIRDQPSDVYGFLYPVLISPAWALFDAVPQAYAAAKAMNAVMMSLAAVPAYFLARRVVAPGLSLVAAVLTVAVPNMAYTATVMTENAFYPLFVAAALAVVLWLERPTRLRTVVVLAACLAAFLTRSQALALLPALLTAPLIVAGRAALRRYALMYAICIVGALGVVVVQVARGVSPLAVLGAYEVAGDADYSVGEVAKWFAYHVAELDLAVGVIPFAALILLTLRLTRLASRDRTFVAAAVSLTFWLVLEVAIFASEQTFRIEERNMFYVAPLLFVALLLWVERGMWRPEPLTAIVAVGAAALPLAVPYDEFIRLDAVSDTQALMPLLWLTERGLALTDVDLVVLAGCAVAALAFLFVPRRFALVLPGLLVVYFAISHHPVVAEHRYRSAQHLFGGITAKHRDWVDRTAGREADVSMVWTGNSDKFTVWQNEFFNRSVGRIYTTGPSVPGGLPETPLRVDPKTGYLLTRHGARVRTDYALTDFSLELVGKRLAQDKRATMAVYRVDGPLRQLAFVEGLYPQDTWSKGRVTWTRHDCPGGTLVAELQSDGAIFAEPNTVVARVGGRVVARTDVLPTETKTMRVPLRSDRDTCIVHFEVARTAIPSVVTGGANPDTRILGIHFNRFDYRP